MRTLEHNCAGGLGDGFLNAYTFAFCEKRGFTRGTAWRWSLRELVRTTGCNAIILPVCAWQDHTYSTRVDSQGPDVMDGEDVRAVADYARALGLKLILKAMVNCRDGYWRAYIRFFDSPVPTEPGWDEWFASWEAHVCRVAELAEANRADLLCVGCEMVGTDHREAQWRALIDRVRARYRGPVTYNCDKFQEDRVTWWDAVDVISSSGYYPVDALDENFERIGKVARRFGKPFMFMECGCPARENSEYRPNDWRFGGATSPDAQARWYEAFLAALRRHPFVRGAGWWDWPATRLYPEATARDQDGYCTYGKPANDLLKRFSEALAGKDAPGRYRVVTLCGSTRFKDAFLEAQKRLTLEGNIVLSVGLFGHSGDDEVWTGDTKAMLDDMHKRKIDMADEIYVINVGGFIGQSTRSEIAYAQANGKPVRYLEN